MKHKQIEISKAVSRFNHMEHRLLRSDGNLGNGNTAMPDVQALYLKIVSVDYDNYTHHHGNGLLSRRPVNLQPITHAQSLPGNLNALEVRDVPMTTFKQLTV